MKRDSKGRFVAARRNPKAPKKPAPKSSKAEAKKIARGYDQLTLTETGNLKKDYHQRPLFNPVRGDEHAKEILRLRRKHAAAMKALLKKPKKRKNVSFFTDASGTRHPIRGSRGYVGWGAKGG